jgi:hypothetical protein
MQEKVICFNVFSFLLMSADTAENEIPQELDYYETTLGTASPLILLGPHKEDPVKLLSPGRWTT